MNYIVRNQSDEERVAFIRPFQDVLKTGEGQKPLEEDEERRKKIFAMAIQEVRGFGDGNEKEIEGFFNLIYSHLFVLHPPGTPEAKIYLTSLLQTISSASSDRPSIKYRILSNLFNAIPQTSSLRLAIYNTLLDLATANGELEVLQLSRADVEKWLSEWEITPDEKSAFLKRIVDAYQKAAQPAIAYEFSLSYARSLPSTSSIAQEAAVDIIATALRLPFIFDFDPLFKLDAVVAAKDHEIFSLLQIFLNDGLSEFTVWHKSHPGVLEKYHLEKTQLEHKIRLLTLASLGFSHVGHDLPYSKVAETLQVDATEVEKWAIDVIRAGLVWAKLSQTTQSMHIARATARTFEKEQWEALEKRLVGWKTSLAGVLEVVASARKQNGYGQPTNAA